jgi:thiol:disulfide interchange protein
LMGLVFSLTSFTCTTPFVGSILVLATQGSWLYPILGMLVFSAVFAFPFFLLAIAPQLLAQLPKSGGWLNSVKVVMGFLEIAAAMKFISNVDLVWGWGFFTREVVIASWIAVCLFVTIYLLGFFQLSHDTKPERLGAVRVLIALLFLSFGFYLFTGLFGKNLVGVEAFLPPKTESSTAVSAAGNTNSSGELTWITNDFNQAVEQAKKENKAIFIDFTGYTCTNCRWMEANMFPQPKVKEELAKFTRAKLYTDGEGEPYEGYQKMQEEKFGTVALPLYAIVTPEGNKLATFPGMTRDENEFIKFLKAGQR